MKIKVYQKTEFCTITPFKATIIGETTHHWKLQYRTHTFQILKGACQTLTPRQLEKLKNESEESTTST